MHSTAIIISIVFVILYTSSVDCSELKFHPRRTIHKRTLSYESPEFCPDRSILVESECRNILPPDSVCSGHHIVVRGQCRRAFRKGVGECGNLYEKIGAYCIESVTGDIPCPTGKTRIGGVCRDVVHLGSLCPEGSRMIQGKCHTELPVLGPCPEMYELFDGECREIKS